MALRRNLRTAGPDGEPHGSPIGFLFSCPDPLRKGRFKIRLFLIQQGCHTRAFTPLNLRFTGDPGWI